MKINQLNMFEPFQDDFFTNVNKRFRYFSLSKSKRLPCFCQNYFL